MIMSIEERLNLIEFRQELLFVNSDFSRFLFETEITREQQNKLFDLLDKLSKKIRSGEELNSTDYERKVDQIVPGAGYHFAESFVHLLHIEERWTEVFEGLYGNSPKFHHYLNKANSKE